MNKPGNKNMIVRDLGFSLLAEGRILKIKADGYSMYPSIKPGTTIFIKPLAENSDILPGEIIAWKRESGFVVHRFVRSEKNGNEVLYYTRGDSCIREDKPVTRYQIAGKVVSTEDRKGRITEGEKMIRKPCHYTNMIIVRLLLIIKRILKLSLIKSAGSPKIIYFFLIPLWHFVMTLLLLCGLQNFNHKVTIRTAQRFTKDLFNDPAIIYSEVSHRYESEI